MATTRILLGIFCCIALGFGTQSGSSFLAPRVVKIKQIKSSAYKNEESTDRDQLINIARSQLGVREASGKNDGQQVEAYLKVTKLPKGHPWCAAFVSWVFAKAGYEKPRTAWSPVLFPIARSTLIPKPADVLGIYSIKLKRIAHAGLVEQRQKDWIISLEGNTNAIGAREGDGVYRKRRHIKTIAKFANWAKK